MWILQFSAAFFTLWLKPPVGSMRLIGLESFDPVGERFEVHIEGTKYGGMAAQAHFDWACPLLKLGQKSRFQALVPRIDVGLEPLFHALQVLFHLFVQVTVL
jgi:hypothetical protein